MKGSALEPLPKETPRPLIGRRSEANDPPRKDVIQMIAGGPIGGDSHRAGKPQVQEAHKATLKKVLDVETLEDTLLIQFG
ncbi:UNVERIFIED_CONTAM: hypothetical protein Sradi_3143600 [Sesamum radiatum]|uniref:Uncharacterized protein n=1 Tax=Sesamum radiatum TaxID=300843 RepID=A0AAW2RE06_SESRA